MVITKDQFRAANARGAAAVARGPIAQAARYDSRRGLIVITLEGGCEFAFPVALAEGLADAPRSKLRKIKISPNGLGLHWPLLDADLYVARPHRRCLRFTSVDATDWQTRRVKPQFDQERPPVRTVSAAVAPK
jgi:hypothetical protein